MAAPDNELERVEALYAKLRRTVIYHLVFLVACIFAALVFRRALNYPPMLSWVIFAVPAVVFGADFIRYFACRAKLARLRQDASSH
ncbi:MAG: hypothetical protein Q7S40_10195 [Opitutaceae bacterium]|nr:hypothetical protein [Opitutaceae bacterium]